jgi:hypothetical protein
VDNTNSATHTYTNVSFSEPNPRRHIIVGLNEFQGGSNFAAPHACTIGGVAATLVLQSGATGVQVRQIWIAAVPTGLTGSVVIQRAGTMSSAIIVWAAYDLSSATAYGTALGSFGHPATASLNTPSGGIAVAFVVVGNGGVNISWSGGLTEDTDFSQGAGARMSGASASRTPQAAPLAISASNSGSVGGTMYAASFF